MNLQRSFRAKAQVRPLTGAGIEIVQIGLLYQL